MTEPEPRSLIPTVSLIVTTVAVVVMAIWGYQAVTAPIEDDTTPSSSGDPTCAPGEETVVEFVRRADVTVSVYNAGERSGRAQDTMDVLERAGFKPGAVGNAPQGTVVRRAEVLTTKANDPAAKLVALAFGPNTEVKVVEDAGGPGIDVYIGDRFNKLDAAAARRVKLPEPEVSCN